MEFTTRPATMASLNGVQDKENSACCLSHEFHKAASRNPAKIAAIHASGGARIAREVHHTATTSDANDGALPVVSCTKIASSRPPVYEGDEWFTYSDILTAVNTLSARLRTILDGGHHPHVIKPMSGTRKRDAAEAQLSDGHMPKRGETLGQIEQNLANDPITFTPRIVGIYMEPSVDYIVAVLSVLRCGEAFLPLDPSWPNERILSVISSSRADLVIGCTSLDAVQRSCHRLDKLDWLIESQVCCVLPVSLKEVVQEQCSMLNFAWPCENGTPRAFCYLMYTSGSTGTPKGVCGTEIGLLNRFVWMQKLYPLHGEECVLFKTPISFIDHLQEFLGAVLVTCTVVIPPFNQLKENPFYVVDFLQEYSINRFVSIPSFMRAIIPALQSPFYVRVRDSLKLLVLSGEVFPTSLWEILLKLLPQTAILNLYGCTEVAGDCMYFDCKRLPVILEKDALSSVPIGLPISNCNLVLLGEVPDEGEICVSGDCNAAGYYCCSSIVPLDSIEITKDFSLDYARECELQFYYRTGDFARQLQSGDLVFLGRKDRTIKVNGQRIALEEIEGALRKNSNVADVAVISRRGQGELLHLEAFLVPKHKDNYDGSLKSSIRGWLVSKLPPAMIPSNLIFVESLPMSSTGKVEYSRLTTYSTRSGMFPQTEVEQPFDRGLLQVIEKAFSDALMIEEIAFDADFFEMGGSSISAAHVCYHLGINMKDLYAHPTPSKLHTAFLNKKISSKLNLRSDFHEKDQRALEESKLHSVNSRSPAICSSRASTRLSNDLYTTSVDHPNKCLKIDPNLYVVTSDAIGRENFYWNSSSLHMACSVSRSNKVMHVGPSEENCLCQTIWSQDVPREKKGSLQELWKVDMGSCVDASPLIVFKESDIYIFIGSHSFKFICINAKSGSVHWEVKLSGRVECSAAILDDLSQVVVGCYEGKIYFLCLSNGSISWSFQTHGEVKSQPVVDKSRHLVWCGSYDHSLYALDYERHCCVFKFSCGGSIFGSPAIDEVHGRIYVASTNGSVASLCIKAFPFTKLWQLEFEAALFGSLSVCGANGNVICCLVDGSVIALNMTGSIVWKGKTGGPIFAGPCISRTLLSQVLVCSRDGRIYSFELDTGDLLWNYDLGRPLTSSAYIDDNFQLVSDASSLNDRLVCVCSSSGSVHVLRIKLDACRLPSQSKEEIVDEFAVVDLKGEIFSSPVMICGRIFVGCRDDYVHCIRIEAEI